MAPVLPHPFLVSEHVKIYKMKDEVAAVKELAKIQVFYCFHYAAAVCNRVQDEFIGVGKMLMKIGVQSIGRLSLDIWLIDCTRFLLT